MKRISDFFGAVQSYLKRTGSEALDWFRKSGVFWRWIASVFVVMALCWPLPGSLSERIRWTGVAFEFLGISLVILGVSRARRSFGRPSILKGWMLLIADARFIFVRRPPRRYSVIVDAPANFEVRMGTAVLRASGTVEERIAQLEREVLELRSRAASIEQQAHQEIGRLRKKVDLEIAERRASDEQVSKRLEEGLIGDSSLEIAGVAYLYLSLLLVNFPSGIAGFLANAGVH